MEWFLRGTNEQACAGTVQRVQYAALTDTPIGGDWEGLPGGGGGLDKVGAHRGTAGRSEFFLRESNAKGSVPLMRRVFGTVGDLPVVGNWDGGTDGDKIGIFRPSTNEFFLRSSNGSTATVDRFKFGTTGDLPVAGNWDGSVDGSDEVGLYRPSSNEFFLRSANGSGGSPSVTRRQLGSTGDKPLTGDWDRDGTDTIAVHRMSASRFFFNNATTGGGSEFDLIFGTTTDRGVVGDWDGPSVDDTTGACAGP
jgi:hypothetical protein